MLLLCCAVLRVVVCAKSPLFLTCAASDAKRTSRPLTTDGVLALSSAQACVALATDEAAQRGHWAAQAEEGLARLAWQHSRALVVVGLLDAEAICRCGLLALCACSGLVPVELVLSGGNFSAFGKLQQSEALIDLLIQGAWRGARVVLSAIMGIPLPSTRFGRDLKSRCLKFVSQIWEFICILL